MWQTTFYYNSVYAIILFFFLTSFFGCDKKAEHSVPESYQVFYPIRKDTSYQKEYIAEIQSVRYAEVRSRVKGHIEQIHVDEGHMVKEGQLLFSISSKEYELELQKTNAALKVAIADLKAAEVELSNVSSLVKKNIMSEAELAMTNARVDALKAKVEEAEAMKQQASLNLSFSKIKAPYKGKINRIPNKVGSLVEDGSVLTTISDNSEVFAYFNLSENDYLNYRNEVNAKQTQNVKLLLSNNQLYPFEGKVEVSESEFDLSTGNIAFRARFSNPEILLKHGSNGKILLNKKVAKALIIPQKSTFEIQDKLYVFVVDKDNKVQQRSITSSIRLPHLYIVQSGLKEDDKIVFEGTQSLRQGDKIAPKLITQNEMINKLSKK